MNERFTIDKFEVIPFKNESDITKIKKYLNKKSNKRDYTIFVMGINVGMRAGDLLKLKVSDVFENGKCKQSVSITEEKTDKKRVVTLNDSVQDTLTSYYNSLKDKEQEYLFTSQKGGMIEVRSLNKMVQKWASECKVKGHYGTHSLRKTFGYHVYMANIDNPRILLMLQKIYNHSSSNITLRYIGIEQEEIDDIYNTLNL